MITRKLEQLTPAQEITLRDHHEKWFQIGSSTDRADRPRAESAIAQMYREIGEKPPIFVWCDSPATSVLAMTIMRRCSGSDAWDSLWDSLEASLGASLEDSIGASLRASLQNSLGDSLWASLWDSLRASLEDSLEDSLEASLQDSIWDSIWDSLQDSIWDSLQDSLEASLRASIQDSLEASLEASLGASLEDSIRASRFWGAHESYWIAYYLFCAEVLGVEFDRAKFDHLSMWSEIAKSAGWWWPYRGICFVTERPTSVHWDAGDRPQIHCEDGPAVAFADSWSVYAWHGVVVPAVWINNRDSIDVKELMLHKNIETRRAGLEIVGWDRVLRELRAVVVDENSDPQIGTLLRADLPDAPGSQFLRVQCGTGRVFAIPVPQNITTALEANAWTYGLQPDELQLEQRT